MDAEGKREILVEITRGYIALKWVVEELQSIDERLKLAREFYELGDDDSLKLAGEIIWGASR